MPERRGIIPVRLTSEKTIRLDRPEEPVADVLDLPDDVRSAAQVLTDLGPAPIVRVRRQCGRRDFRLRINGRTDRLSLSRFATQPQATEAECERGPEGGEERLEERAAGWHRVVRCPTNAS